jgi:DNA-binding IclR family transcriptional regulator
MNMTSTYRYINTLQELGYLEKDLKTKEIRPSILCQLLCNNLTQATDRLRLVKAVVDRIHRENNISIDVVLIVDDTLRRLYHRVAQETLTYSLPDEAKHCLHNTALGKAYLFSLPGDQLPGKIGALKLAARTSQTIVDAALLIKQLQAYKRRGYAMCAEEYLQGLVAIGAPLMDTTRGKGIGAVSFDFSILQHSAGEIEAKYGTMIIETAQSLSEVLSA